jgi:hypothetical protein
MWQNCAASHEHLPLKYKPQSVCEFQLSPFPWKMSLFLRIKCISGVDIKKQTGNTVSYDW